MPSETIVIDEASARSLLDRFTSFGDALIDTVTIEDFGRRGSMRVTVALQSRDKDGVYHRVAFEFERVSDVTIREGYQRTCCVVFEMSIEFPSGSIRVDFDGQEKSDFEVISKQVKCTIENM